jgi:hypothetical protein
VWGAMNLWLVGARRNFAGVEYSGILAHGHAMVFGVVGFFIMGLTAAAAFMILHFAMKLSRGARQQGISPLTAWRGFTAGKLLVPAQEAIGCTLSKHSASS